MSQSLPCPSPDELRRLILGQASKSDTELWSRHIEECDRCVTAIRTLNADADDTLLSALVNEPKQTDPLLSEAAVSRLIDRMKRLGRLAGGDSTDLGAADTAVRTTTGADAGHVEESCAFLAPAAAPDELGHLGPFRVLSVLGTGGMGIVFEAEDAHLMRRVALKVLKPPLSENRAARDRFLREARLAASIEHDHIVTIYQVGAEAGVSFLAMQRLHGETLQQRLDRERRLSVADSLRIGREIAEGLAAAHARGLLHRDIKPANVFLSQPAALERRLENVAEANAESEPKATTAKVKLLDFGLARAVQDDLHLTHAGTITGTPAYMSPEQAMDERVDHRCDLFSLGCVLYQMTTGQVPFGGRNVTSILLAIIGQSPASPRSLNPDLPVDLEALILELLAKSPAQRCQSASEVASRIREIEAALPVAVSRASMPIPSGLPPQELPRGAAPATSPESPPVVDRSIQGYPRTDATRRLATVIAGVCLAAIGAIGGLIAMNRGPQVSPIDGEPDAGRGGAEIASVEAGSADRSSSPAPRDGDSRRTAPGQSSVAVTSRDKGGYDVRGSDYEAVVSPKGSIEELYVGGIAAIRGTSLGKMQSDRPVTVQQNGDTLTFVSGDDYRIEMTFRGDGFTLRTKVSENAGKQDAIDGKWAYLWLINQFTPEAQLVESYEPVGRFVLPATAVQACDRFTVTFSNGSKIQLTESGDATFPNDPGGFGPGWLPRYAWVRGYMKPDKEYQYDYRIIPGKPGETVLTMPPLVIESSAPPRWIERSRDLIFTARVRRQDAGKLAGRENDARVRWVISDLFDTTVREETTPLRDVRSLLSSKDAGNTAPSPPSADRISSMSVPTDRVGWFRVKVTLEDASGKAIPNLVQSDYAVIRPGLLPDLPASTPDAAPGVNPDYSAWLGLGLERISDTSILPAIAQSARRTGLRYFHQIQLPAGVTSGEAFARHVRDVVTKYRADCPAWEIINEPRANLTPETYAEYLQAAHTVIKEIDPQALVLGPAALGFDLDYIDRLYQLGVGKLLDVVTVHPHTAHWRGWVEQDVGKQYRNLRELMKKHGDESKPVWFTESGFQHTFWITPIPEVQARFVVQEFLLAASWGLPANRIYYFFLKDHGFENWYLLRMDNSLSPAAAGLRNFAQQTQGLTAEGTLDVGRNRIGVRFRGPDRQVVALFSYDFPTITTLRTDADQVTVADFFGNETTLAGRSGELKVPVSGYPVYLKFASDAAIAGVADDWGTNLASGGIALASSGQPTASQVLDGVHTANGAHEAVPGWVSDKENAFPQWIEVKLPEPAEIRRVMVYTNSSYCGIAGPRDFDVQVRTAEGWRTVKEERGNVDRWVFEYPVEAVTTDRLRVVVHRVNNGGLRDDPRPYADLTARVSEIEAYAR